MKFSLVIGSILIILCSAYYFTDWKIKHRAKRQISFLKHNPKKNDIILCGDSHIEFFDLNLLKNKNAYNFGISGEKTRGLISRIDNIMHMESRNIICLTGINDFLAGKSNKTILDNFENLISKIIKNQTNHSITFLSIYPIATDKIKKSDIVEINNYIKHQCLKNDFNFIDVHEHLTDINGVLNKKYTSDGIHLNKKGQTKVADIINAYTTNFFQSLDYGFSLFNDTSNLNQFAPKLNSISKKPLTSLHHRFDVLYYAILT
ncbi:GDSL-type esterase/lipase family protein [Algibacter lectus]|uniref:GDSL-type esterase/lipase family protein n=1 Tax=Algibacter lectus TaxID=221126 RepID=UPI0026EBF18F|nr:GDSL-type esterase/lipase family protein [Algibacter lectus]MDO7138865.1 GDSL-type esterase/lipase family protein [Algibacter lectus]